MQIMRVSSNSNNNKTNFKGETEQKIFQQVFRTSELKGLLKKDPINNKLSIEDYFVSKFNELEQIFSKNKSFKKGKKIKNTNSFNFRIGNEKIIITLVPQKEGSSIYYFERKRVSKGLYQTHSIYLSGDAKRGEISRIKAIGSMIKGIKDMPFRATIERLSETDKKFKYADGISSGTVKKGLIEEIKYK